MLWETRDLRTELEYFLCLAKIENPLQFVANLSRLQLLLDDRDDLVSVIRKINE